MVMVVRCIHSGVVRALILLFLLAIGTSAQEMSNLERSQALDMLQVVANDVRKHYYDPKLHGIDWEAQIAKAKQQIATTNSMNMAISYIAAAVDSLNDSHTTFFPPERLHRYYYGWPYQMIGDRCYITHIRPNTDADRKGVKSGDEVLTINGILPDSPLIDQAVTLKFRLLSTSSKSE